MKSKNKKLIMLVGVLIPIIGILLFISNNKEEILLNDTKEVSNNNVIAFRIQDGDNYVKSDTIPTSGYVFNENLSKCGLLDSEGSIIKDDSISITYNDNGTMSFDNITKEGIKCYIYFDKFLAKDTILADNGGATAIEAKTTPDFSKTSCAANTNCSDKSSCTTSCDEETNGMYAAEDADGTTYYYRGSVDNNWVSFAGFYWRIIRVNGNGSIRLIYNGKTTDQTGGGTQIGTSTFNENNDDNAYVGYMYGTVGSDNYTDTHTNTNSSTIKSALDSWYESNLKTNYVSYLDGNTGWCGDRTSNTSSSGTPTLGTSGGYGTSDTYYGANYRLYKSKTPSYECTQSNDLYTVSGSTKGNKELLYPIGLITADEVMYAGGKNANNYGYWLYTGFNYRTMSPAQYSLVIKSIYYVQLHGYLDSRMDILDVMGVRPVINLKADTVFSSGNGQADSPYTVKVS